jgi:hypothetical protein
MSRAAGSGRGETSHGRCEGLWAQPARGPPPPPPPLAGRWDAISARPRRRGQRSAVAVAPRRELSGTCAARGWLILARRRLRLPSGRQRRRRSAARRLSEPIVRVKTLARSERTRPSVGAGDNKCKHYKCMRYQCKRLHHLTVEALACLKFRPSVGTVTGGRPSQGGEMGERSLRSCGGACTCTPSA